MAGKVCIYGTTKREVERLNTMKYMVDIEFTCLKIFNKAVDLGFDPASWRERNKPNRILIRYEDEVLAPFFNSPKMR
jgi:hypothetical protein